MSRLNDLPQLPNASEVGMRDMGDFLGWSVLVGPRDLPATVVERWKVALKQLAHDPAWIAGTAARGGIPALGTAKDSGKFLKSQFELFDNLISVLNLRQ